ncbi:hypothetical protein MMC28_003835 [Mycoblastus sanguinarius]|nr:hypothetical protein [Mycoblastus sanguinarius]
MGMNTTSLSLHAELLQVNSTHTTLILINEASEDLSLLKWNSLFHSRAEYHSFYINALGNGTKFSAGPQMVRWLYAGLDQSHILKLPAHSNWTGVFDLTKIFSIPTTSQYSVSFTDTLNTLLNPPTANSTHTVMVSSQPCIMNLTSSAPTKATRSTAESAKMTKRDSINSCDAAQTWIIKTTLGTVSQMAEYAYHGVFSNLSFYETYFNNKSSNVVNDVAQVFHSIQDYNIAVNTGLS